MEARWDLNRRKLRDLVERSSLDALVLVGGPNITYATGLREPTGALIITRDCGDYLVTSVLDYNRAASGLPKDVEVKAYYRREGEVGVGTAMVPESDLLQGGFEDAVKQLLSRCGAKSVGADLRWAGPDATKAAQAVGARDVSDEVAKLRSVKDDWEVEAIGVAIAVAEQAFREALELLDSTPSEAEVRGAFFSSLMRQGAWGEAFPTIVAFYDNTALPHHTPTTVRLSRPGPVLVDFGAHVGGYMSDTTRSFWRGSGGAEYRRLVEIVAESQSAAIDVVGPGVEARNPDLAARKVLAKEGLDKYFNHGLGHGVGVEIHEEPYLGPTSKGVLEPGMVITVEPGIYMPGLYGVRIEDMVLVTKKGARLLTKLSRALF